MLSTQTESTSTLTCDSPDIPEQGINRRPGAFSDMKRTCRRALDWMSPFRIWRELRMMQTARRDFAAGLAVGVFIACVPLYGLQTILGLFAARRLSLHPLPVLAGSQLSAPPIAPVLAVASVVLGHAVLSGTLPNPADWHIAHWHVAHWHITHWPGVSMSSVFSFLVSWFIGGAVLGLILAGITYVTTTAAMRLLFRRTDPQPAQ
jgi:uncharacterized protein (DUF2062 family)